MPVVKNGICGIENIFPRNYPYLLVILLVGIIFWFNLLSNEQSVGYVLVIDNVNIAQNRTQISNTSVLTDNQSTNDLEGQNNEEVISYVISSDNELNYENQVNSFSGAVDLFSGYFYHPAACQRIADVVKKNRPSIAVSAIQQKSQTRLGNQLSNFASGYAIWRDFGILNYIDPEQLQIIGKVFKLPRYEDEEDDATYYTWLKGCLKFMDTIKWTTFNQTLLDISAPRQHMDELKFGHYIKLPTYVADFTGFAPYAKDLKAKVFKFHKKLSGVAGKLYKMMIQKATKKFQGNEVQNFTTVSIHIRLTDFGHHLKDMFHVTYAPPEYFSRAMQYFTDRYQNVLFYLVSDDFDAARKYLFTKENEKFNIVLPYNGNRKVAGADLALLSLSDHNIITFGTFGLWGALLGKDKKITICPKDFAKTDIGKEVHKAKRPDWIFL